MVKISDEFSAYKYNTLVGSGKKGIITGGVNYEYVMEVIGDRKDIKVLKIATPNPFPEKLAVEFLEGLEEVLAIEELDPYLEKQLTYVCGKYNKNVIVKGKLTHHIANAGENTVLTLSKNIADFLGEEVLKLDKLEETPALPVRPPVLCAGCPHRASFYAVKMVMKGKKADFSGDIGCYTLGNAMPLDMVDTCLCMGADVTMAQGLGKIDKDGYHFAFIGDSTFFASGITGVVNAVYNEANMTLVVLFPFCLNNKKIF